MKLIWTTTASLVLFSGEYCIAFDPFMEMPLDKPVYEPGRPELAELYKKAERVYLTHGHFDHTYHLKDIYRYTNTSIFGSPAALESVSNKEGFESDQLIEIGPGYKDSYGSFEIEAYQGKHCRFDLPIIAKTLFSKRTLTNLKRLIEIQSIRKEYRENSEMLFYEIRAESKRIQILGSMGLDPMTDYPTGADLLIMALQGRSDQDRYAIQFVERLKPNKIFLYHTDDSFPPISGEVDTLGFEINAKKAGVETIRPEKGKEYVI
ncbi:MAG: MBL fold metallo-hydrolase [Firmicutes bacterium]|nr:MBL fold metallo-hydrolase [Bacillota bacterium]